MALTATTLPALGIVKLALNWAPYRQELVSIYRVEPDGGEVEVLGSPVTLSGSDAIVYDTTAPLDVALTYRAVLTNPTVLADSFTRETASTWSVPDFSVGAGSYVNFTGATSDYYTNQTEGSHNITAVSSARNTINPSGTYGDLRIEATTRIPVSPVGAPIRTSVMTRFIDVANMYQFVVVHNTNNTITLSIIKRVANVETTIASTTTTLVPAVNRRFRIIAESVGTKHRMTVWTYTGPSHAAYLEVSDSTFLAAGRFGFRSVLNTGNSNTLPVTAHFDNVKVTSLTSLTLTSGTVTIVAAPHGWIRDPLVPANSVRLDNCASHTFDCLDANQMVFFQGFGDEDYASKSGVFDVNNADRPVVVAQRRKDPTTDLRFASVTLADITRVRTLFKSGRNLALSLDPDYGWALDSYGTAMFTAGDLRASRLNQRQMRKPYRLWTTEIAPTDLDDDLPHGTVGGNGIPIPGATLGDLKATGMTLGQIKATGNTLLEIAQGVYS